MRRRSWQTSTSSGSRRRGRNAMAWVRVLEYQLDSKHLACIEECSVLIMPASAENIITYTYICILVS